MKQTAVRLLNPNSGLFYLLFNPLNSFFAVCVAKLQQIHPCEIHAYGYLPSVDAFCGIKGLGS